MEKGCAFYWTSEYRIIHKCEDQLKVKEIEKLPNLLTQTLNYRNNQEKQIEHVWYQVEALIIGYTIIGILLKVNWKAVSSNNPFSKKSRQVTRQIYPLKSLSKTFLFFLKGILCPILPEMEIYLK